MAQLHQLIRQTPFSAALTLVCFSAIFLIYLTGVGSEEQLAAFSRHYSDILFLALILFAVFTQFKSTSSLVDPIFWLLLGAAFFSWFLVAVTQYFFLQKLSTTSLNLITNLGYFLFYSLSIAAIEVKSYQKASDLLTSQSLLIWTSTFSFILGAFIFLVLTSSQQIISKEGGFNSFFVYFILMDIYLMLRWFQLAWVCRETFWLGFALFGIAAFNWIFADLLEGLFIAGQIEISAGSWLDWVWFTPYFFVFAATQFKISTAQEQNSSRSFSRSHLLNSPTFFLIFSFLLFQIITNETLLSITLNSTQETFFNIWFSFLFLLTVVQFYLMSSRLKKTEGQLSEVKTTTAAMKQRLIQQAQSLKDQVTSNAAILETTDNAIFTLNNDGEILSCNPAACRLLALKKEELVGANFIDVTQAEGELNRHFTYKSYQQKITRNARGIEVESTIRNQKGTKIPVHATLSKKQNSREGFLVVSLVNISEQKRAELEALNLKDQFTANISHEFRTPLTIINGVLDDLMEQDKYVNDKDQLNSAKRNSMRMIRMVEQLLELSKMANDSMPLAPINVQPEVLFVCNSFHEIAKNTDIKFITKITDEAWVEGNSPALEKILYNLLSNAFKYTEKGQIKVTLEPQANQFVLTISDTGIGVDEEHLSRIFERFHRVTSTETQNIHGVGIGLALVKELCDAMRWTIQVESTVGQGSTFTVTMPGTDKLTNEQPTHVSTTIQSSVAAEVLESQSPKNQNAQPKSKYSVLIIEDNLDMQNHIAGILSPFHHCLLASTGEEGLRLAADYLPDIVISDIMMPGISGFEVLKSLKSSELTCHMPVILLTARGDNESKLRGLEGEADDYLSKPFNAEELRLRVINQLTSRQKLQQKLVNQWQQSSPEQTIPFIEDKFLNHLDDIFERNYKNCDFSMVDLANELAMSDRQVQRKVKSLLGISPQDALKHFRLIKAHARIESGEQIGIVAQSCGFSSQSYFGRCFKDEFEVTPKAFQLASRE